MASSLVVPTSALPVSAAASDPYSTISVFHGGGDTVYYGGPSVTSSSFTGSLTSGQSVSITSTTWFVSAGTSSLEIVESPGTIGGRSELAAAIVTADIAITTSMADLAGFVTPSFNPAGASLEIVLSVPEVITANATFQVLDTGNANLVVAKGKTVAAGGVTVRGLMGSTSGARTFKVQGQGVSAATLKADALGQTATLSIITR